MEKSFAIFMALLAYTLLSMGIVLMKKGVACFGWKGKKNRRFYAYLGAWIAGFSIMNLNGIPNAIALKTLPPHIVAACAGWGIVILIFFSSWVLKENVFNSDFIFAGLIVVSIFLLNFFEKPIVVENPVSLSGLFIISLLPFALMPVLFFKVITKKVKTVVYAALSGLAAGLLVVFLKMLMIAYGFQVGRFFGSIYLYAYIFAALISLIALQLANKSGDMIVIGPVQYSCQIIYPAVSTYVVFGQSLTLMQIAAIISIIYSVHRILKKR
jgi:multidrug transporter EmrE-like cation transporter